ncbi:MAG TPA: hypothetical protein VGS79_26715 [Puia sp.]|nr:hypothetical protein [Puia sp.]
MDFTEIKETILSFDDLTSERMKKYIHYRSIRNFVCHFDDIKSEMARARVCKMLSDYIEEVRAKDFDFAGKEESLQLARKYLSPLADYYKEDANFMVVIKIKFVFIIGIIGDGILYFSGLSSAILHIPIVTIAFLLYYLFILVFKVQKGRVWAIFY